jgi:hypothetical protein
MMAATRFTITDPVAASVATAALPAAMRTLAATITVTSQDLTPYPGDPITPTIVLDALIKWQRGAVRRDRRINTLMLLIHEAGASERALADALGLGRSTVTARLAAARADRATDGTTP